MLQQIKFYAGQFPENKFEYLKAGYQCSAMSMYSFLDALAADIFSGKRQAHLRTLLGLVCLSVGP